jgi:hypothetical protein
MFGVWVVINILVKECDTMHKRNKWENTFPLKYGASE